MSSTIIHGTTAQYCHLRRLLWLTFPVIHFRYLSPYTKGGFQTHNQHVCRFAIAVKISLVHELSLELVEFATYSKRLLGDLGLSNVHPLMIHGTGLMVTFLASSLNRLDFSHLLPGYQEHQELEL